MAKQVQLLFPLEGLEDEILLPQECEEEIVPSMEILLLQVLVAEEKKEDDDDRRS
jgi:hypothetical protein